MGRGEGGGEGALKGNLGRPAFTLFETKIVHFTSLFKSGCTSFHDHDSKKKHATKVTKNNLKKTLSLNIKSITVWSPQIEK